MKKLWLIFVVVLFSSSISYSQWYQIDSLPQSNNLFAVDFINSDTGWAVGSNGTIIRTTDSGITWIIQNSGTTGSLFDVQFINDSIGTAVGGIAVNGGTESIILRTTNCGIDWVSQWNGSGYFLYRVSFTNIYNGIVVSDWGTIYRTTNSGETWDNTLSRSISFKAVCFFDSIAIAVGGWIFAPPFDSYRIFRTTDDGNTWTGYYCNTYLRDICLFDYSNGIIVGESGTILKTTNGGAYWEPKNSGVTVNLNSIFCVDVNNEWVVGENGTILKTINGGETWSLLNSGTTNNLLDVDFIDTNNGWAIGENGIILYTKNGGVTFIEVENDLTQPKDFLLQQNYPNPFNPITKISWQSPVGSWQTLKIYDLLGKEITTLINEYRPAGSYEVEFNVAQDSSPAITSGVYFYRLQAGDYVETKKMIYLK